MRGLGTLINVGCIIGGGLLGLLCGKNIKDTMRETLISAMGVATIMLAIGGVMEKMLTVSDGGLTSNGSIMMIISLALGAILGEAINIDGAVIRFGEWLKRKTGSEGDASFVAAFVTTSCTVCIGAMAIIGAIQDGISGDYTVLLAKGILDAIIVCIMTAAYDKGSIFSAIPVGILQGSVTLAAVLAGGFMTERALDNLSYVGSVLIFCVGLNLIREKQIRVANMLPALLFAVCFGLLGY